MLDIFFGIAHMLAWRGLPVLDTQSLSSHEKSEYVLIGSGATQLCVRVVSTEACDLEPGAS